MIKFQRYPHINDLVTHYAQDLKDEETQRILNEGVKTKEEAIHLSRFVWVMVDQMALDRKAGKVVLGRTNNGDMLPDLNYEISLYLSDAGFEAEWEKVSDEENP